MHSDDVNREVVLSIKPDHYWKETSKECGTYTAKAVLNAYNLDKHQTPQDMMSPMQKLFLGYTSPNRMLTILKEHGVNAAFKRSKIVTDRLAPLKEELRKNNPVIVLIGNIYTPKRNRMPIRRSVAFHWISLWGYNDDEHKFYVYDSLTKPKYTEKGLPIGNVTLSYEDFLMCWRGMWLTKLFNYSYIPIEVNN